MEIKVSHRGWEKVKKSVDPRAQAEIKWTEFVHLLFEKGEVRCQSESEMSLMHIGNTTVGMGNSIC